MAVSKLDKASQIAIRDCMGAKPNEKVLIITDENKKDIAENLYYNALKLGHEALLLEMKSRDMDGEEPPKEVAELMKMFNVILIPTTKSMTHTDARRNASEKGARCATLPGITEEIMIKGLNADYTQIAALTLKLKRLFEKTKIIKVQTALGTDISLDITGRKAFASKGLFHKKGESGNLPTGETFAAPVEGKTNGVFIVDGSMSGIGKILEPIRIEVKNGLVENVTGGAEARKLNKIIKQYGKPARNIAEFGIGTNHKAKLTGELLLDEKVMGTIHIAIGDNKSMGGKVNAPIHLDGVVTKPNVFFDDKQIMKNGKLLV